MAPLQPAAPLPAAATTDSHPLSRALLEAVLADRLSDRFVCELVWTRLGYRPANPATPATPVTGSPVTTPATTDSSPATSSPAPEEELKPDPSAPNAAAVLPALSVPWTAGPATPADWAEAFPVAPELIATRPASVRLTRSIAAEHKQLLKQQLGFAGYRIGELYPRRTRRATAVNWLLAQLAERGEPLPELGPLPPLLEPPLDPVQGHPGDLAVG
jgi:hypothetical protein